MAWGRSTDAPDEEMGRCGGRGPAKARRRPLRHARMPHKVTTIADSTFQVPGLRSGPRQQRQHAGQPGTRVGSVLLTVCGRRYGQRARGPAFAGTGGAGTHAPRRASRSRGAAFWWQQAALAAVALCGSLKPGGMHVDGGLASATSKRIKTSHGASRVVSMGD